MKKFSIKQLFSYGLAVVTQKFAAFIILPIIAAHLSMKDFGLVNQIISIGGFYILIVMLGLDESIAKKGFDTDEKKELYIANGFFLLSINALFFIVLGSLFSHFFYDNFIESTSSILITLSIVIVSSTPFYLVYLKILRLSNNSREFFFIVVCQVILQSGLLILFVVYLNLNAIGFLMSHAIAAVFCSLYSLVKFKSMIKPSLLSSRVIKELLSYGCKIAPHSISTWGLWGLSVVYTGKYLGSEFSAQLVAVNYIPLIASVISFAFFYTYQPWLYENFKKKQSSFTIKKNIVMFASVFLIVLFIIFLLSNYIFEFLFDERYSIDTSLTLVLLLACFFQFIGSMFTYILYYFESVTKYVAISTVIGGVTNLALLIMLSSKFGLLGVGFSFMFAQFFVMIIRASISISTLITYEQNLSVELNN